MQLSRASIPKCVQRFRARNPQWIGNRESNNPVKSCFPRLSAPELQVVFQELEVGGKVSNYLFDIEIVLLAAFSLNHGP
ncbi:hypothetical protein CROQUDRAFT_111456 [Cronartium quercuum f. sp. fusiforme G11]|uniref:Uncharacterized protein n=1 Tax=Cronartium quercuum f. sp. fusiforme G11 TaxID=708437 RepID=A0A9P6N6I7_9BASI|nr:hypothetical protein CROQUDRAFT_111456 [Cronartium quercuum f. sp. fusiforme G11]